MARPKVTVYTPSQNYGRFLAEAAESVFRQVLPDWELIILDDGSTDETAAVAAGLVQRDPERVRVHRNPRPQGLRSCANAALEMARGEYVLRLDADDYLDEAALLVLASYLDRHPEVALVYPGWTYVSEDGTPLAVERRRKLAPDTAVLDLPPHGACTLVRRRVLKSIGGYDEAFDAQDGHELWMKVLHRHKVGNVTTPLFFYRQHGDSMSRNQERLLASRQRIKTTVARRHGGTVQPRIVAVIPAKNTYQSLPNIALVPLAGRPLIDHTLDAALGAGICSTAFVFTDDEAVVRHCQERSGIVAALRPPELSQPRVKLADVLNAAVDHLEARCGIYADILVLMNVHTPLCRASHVREAVDTLLVYDVDTVISTYEDYDLHFLHTSQGMRPLNPGMINRIRLEREALYVDNGAVHALWRDTVSSAGLFEGRIGHFVMPRSSSHTIKSPEDLALLETLVRQNKPTSP